MTFVLLLCAFLWLLAVAAAIGDSWERRDARRRNSPRGRARRW